MMLHTVMSWTLLLVEFEPGSHDSKSEALTIQPPRYFSYVSGIWSGVLHGTYRVFITNEQVLINHLED